MRHRYIPAALLSLLFLLALLLSVINLRAALLPSQ